MTSDVGSKFFAFEILKQASARCLMRLLISVEGIKDLIIDKEIICSLDYIANFTLLKKCNVEKIFKLEPGPSPGKNQKCIYLIRPKVENARIICDHISANLSIEKGKRYLVIYVPRKLSMCENVFEEEGVYESIQELQFPLGFVTLDKDLISLELHDFYKSFFLNSDLNYVHVAAKSLLQLYNICGPIPKIYGQGLCAKMVVDLMSCMIQEMEFPEVLCNQISHLIILDRDIDYVSVLLSQLTYEGILDETFGINSGRIIFPKEVTRKEPVKIALNNNDVVFEEIRNAYFTSVFGTIHEKVRQLQAKSEASGISVEAMKEFVTKEMRSARQQHSSLCIHISASEAIMKKKTIENFQERLQIERDIIGNVTSKEFIGYIEDVICRQEPYENALRLICLLSIAQNGISAADYKSLVTQFCKSYGDNHLLTFNNLKHAGLLVVLPPLLPPSAGKTSKMEKAASVTANIIAEKVVTAVAFPRYSSFKSIIKKFNLITDDEEPSDLKNPQNMNYVFGGGYTPLIGRITEHVIVNDGFKHIEDGLKLLPGSTIINSKTDKDIAEVKATNVFKSKTILVYVLGGITYAEMAALRLLQKHKNCRIFIATTSVISGNSLMQMLSQPSD